MVVIPNTHTHTPAPASQAKIFDGGKWKKRNAKENLEFRSNRGPTLSSRALIAPPPHSLINNNFYFAERFSREENLNSQQFARRIVPAAPQRSQNGIAGS